MESQDERGPDTYLGYEFIRRADTLSARFTQALREHGLTSRQFSALAVIAAGTTHSSAELARAIVMTPQSVGTLLDVLESRGWVHRASGTGSRLSTTLSESGQEKLASAYVTVDRLDREVRAALGSDYDELTRILRAWP